MLNFWVFYFGVASYLDWYSTIIQDYTVEETPLVREVWRVYGDVGFTIFDILAMMLTVYIFTLGWNYSKKLRWLLGLAFGILTTFKLLMALTNLDLIPYWVLSFY